MKDNTKDSLNIDFEDLKGVSGGSGYVLPVHPDEGPVEKRYNVVCFQCQGTIATNMRLKDASETVESHRKTGHTPRMEEV